jgi:diaminopimelate epimerase
MKFAKYHALGNDYIVIRPEDLRSEITRDIVRDIVRVICHRNYGIGSDGLLVGPLRSVTCDFGLRIFNPDGSEAEKSGNGLRIFSRYIVDHGLSDGNRFSIETAGGKVKCEVDAGGSWVRVEMGVVSFNSADIPVTGPPREVLNETITAEDQTLLFCAATVGNPHCVVFSDTPTPAEARRLGPIVEMDARFPNRTNVQFMKVVDRGNIRIEIWERGAGYTLASGSSSTAAAAVAYRLNMCDADISVQMPGGRIRIQLKEDYAATMTGPVTKICEGMISDELFGETM